MPKSRVSIGIYLFHLRKCPQKCPQTYLATQPIHAANSANSAKFANISNVG
ncbi:hypothetical protein D8I24_5686 [Cupriavidus necator H850]|nr:hypothetical protein D8I24_5686 [Cupriavidus necator H850]